MNHCNELCEYRTETHSHCLECGLLTDPVMECKCEFRKKQYCDKCKADLPPNHPLCRKVK